MGTHEEAAREYASFPYSIEVREETVDGKLIFLLSHSELPGCMAHGATLRAALNNLEEARRIYIESLLEDGISVPLPSHLALPTVRSYGTTASGWGSDDVEIKEAIESHA